MQVRVQTDQAASGKRRGRSARGEERDATARYRRGKRLARRRLDALQRDQATRRRRVIEQAVRDAQRAGERCRCELHPGMTDGELRALEGGCTDPWFCCPVLDRVRRRLGL